MWFLYASYSGSFFYLITLLCRKLDIAPSDPSFLVDLPLIISFPLVAELDLVGGMILINRIQQKGWNDSLCLGYQRQCFHLASILFSHSGSDRVGQLRAEFRADSQPWRNHLSTATEWVWMQILPQLILPQVKGWFVLNQHLDESLVSEVNIHPGLPGNQGFLGCRISGFKTRKVLGKMGWLDHLTSKRLWARRSTEIEMINVAGFRVVNLGWFAMQQ